MSPLLFTLLQAAFLVLLYLFVARAVRWVVRDVRAPAPEAAVAPAAGPARPVSRTVTLPRSRRGSRGHAGELVIHTPESPPRVLSLAGEGTITFGRRDDATVVLADPYVSDAHAQVYRDGEEWMLSDAGSTNGTLLNSARLAVPTALQPGDQIAIGRTMIEVRR